MANTKLYRKGLHIACKALLAYIARNRTRLEQNLGDSGVTILVEVVGLVQQLVIYLEEAFPSDYTPA